MTCTICTDTGTVVPNVLNWTHMDRSRIFLAACTECISCSILPREVNDKRSGIMIGCASWSSRSDQLRDQGTRVVWSLVWEWKWCSLFILHLCVWGEGHCSHIPEFQPTQAFDSWTRLSVSVYTAIDSWIVIQLFKNTDWCYFSAELNNFQWDIWISEELGPNHDNSHHLPTFVGACFSLFLCVIMSLSNS